MSAPQVPCPPNSVTYNRTFCACEPGYLYNSTTKNCSFFTFSPEWVVESGVDSAVTFPETIFSFDQIKKFTQSQAVFLEATAVLLASWLLFCVFVRFHELGDGRNIWFQIRWWISRLDVCFATRHWLEDQKVVRKRKTELGGAFSIASWILFIGLLLYQIITGRSVEVHNLKAANAPDLVSFVNDLEFNITAVSTMSCSQLRGLGTIFLGNPGSIDYRASPLSTFSNYSCLNTSRGPTISLRCYNCPLVRDNVYISWQFIDVPSQPASAVAFEFNLTAKSPTQKKHMSLVSGTVRNGTYVGDAPLTFRGTDTNILKFNLFPRIYQNLHGLKLAQPLFHEFLPGSYIRDANELQVSLQNSSNGLINTTLLINFLSDYIVEIDNQNILGPVSFLADLGGLYCISIGIFFYLLVQCEYRVKRLRKEDQVFRNIRSRRKAKDHWDKLRKYVMYTWGPSSLLEDNYNYNYSSDGCCACAKGVSRRKNDSDKRSDRESSLCAISFDKKDRSHKVMAGKHLSEPPKSLKDEDIPPPPPLPVFNGNSTVNVSDIHKNLQDLYEYNAMLRENLVNTQSMLRDLTTKYSSMASEDQT
ncbi:CD97 antigen [Bienertia sinuspersici]